MKKSCFIILLVFAFSTTAMATMVIAPSKIVVNSVSSKGKSSTINNSHNTVKAIISYPLGINEAVNTRENSFHITMTLNNEIEIDAVGIQYCVTDSNLIVEFDRVVIENSVIAEEFNGLIEVLVAGTFTLNKDDGSVAEMTIDSEESEIFFHIRPDNRE